MLPRLGNPYLSQAAFSILADLLSIPVDDPTNTIHLQLQDILQVVLSSSPSKTDSPLIPSWTHLLGTAMLTYHAADADACTKRVPEAWKALWAFMDAQEASIRKAAAQALDMLVKCFTLAFIQAAVKERDAEDAKSQLGKIVSQTSKALGALAYARALPEVMAVIASLLSGLRHRVDAKSPTAAELLLMPVVVKIAALRVQKSFEFKEAADHTLRTAMQVLGPNVLLRELPLNLEPADRYVLTIAQSMSSNINSDKPETSHEPSSSLCFPNLIPHLCHISSLTLSLLRNGCLTCSKQRRARDGNPRRKSGVSLLTRSGLACMGTAMAALT